MRIDDSIQVVQKLPGAGPTKKAGQDFATALESSLNAVDQKMKVADQNIQDLASGKTNRLHETMMSLEEADLSLKMLLQVRNKALEAYREIARMQM
jgi:flagellar hook-basal body complex protein FliE